MTAADLLRSGRRSMEPTRDDRERVRARLAAKLGAAAVGATITTTTAKAAGATAAAKTGTAALALKIVLPLLVIGGAAAVATPHLLHRSQPPAAAPVVVAPPPAPIVTATATPVEPVTSVSVDELPTATPKPAFAPAKKPVNTVTDPAEEAKLVASIDAALRAGDSASALRLADEHAKKYPNGVLVEEREGGRAIARCMSGSRSSADAFLAAHPRSPMRARIVAACGEKP